MTDALLGEMARLWSAYRHGSRLALLFDYDGTLTPIVEHPALATLPPGTRRLLHALSQQRRVRVGVLSGRGLEDLSQRVGIPHLYYAGTCGLELNLRGKRVHHPQASNYDLLLRFVAHRLVELIVDYPGAWVEVKRYGLTLHYRAVAGDRVAALLTQADRVLRWYAEGLHVAPGPLAWEITPGLDWNKGRALGLILEDIGPPVLPVYVGDGANDAEALAEAAARGGLAIGVGDGAPASARHRLDNPGALVEFLHCLAEGTRRVILGHRAGSACVGRSSILES